MLSNRTTVLLTVLWCVTAVLSQSSRVHAGDRDAERVELVVGDETTIPRALSRDLTTAAAEFGLNIKIHLAGNPLDSIDRLLEREQTLLAVVPSDLVNQFSDSLEPRLQAYADPLRLVYPLQTKQVHVLASRSIASLQQLNGKRVVVGVEGGNHWITATNILEQAQVVPAQLRSLAPEASVRAVLRGEADAMFYVGKAPVDLFADFDYWQTSSRYHTLLKDAHFLPVTDARVLQKYDAAKLSQTDYGWNDEDVVTVSVTELLVTQNHADSYASDEMCDRLSRIGDSLRSATRQRSADGANINAKADDGWLLSMRNRPNYMLGLDTAVRGLKSDACSKALPEGIAKLDLIENSMKNPDNLYEDTDSNETLSFENQSESETTGTVDATVVNALQKCLIKGECE